MRVKREVNVIVCGLAHPVGSDKRSHCAKWNPCARIPLGAVAAFITSNKMWALGSLPPPPRHPLPRAAAAPTACACSVPLRNQPRHQSRARGQKSLSNEFDGIRTCDLQGPHFVGSDKRSHCAKWNPCARIPLGAVAAFITSNTPGIGQPGSASKPLWHREETLKTIHGYAT
jgi:hypothetical protein